LEVWENVGQGENDAVYSQMKKKNEISKIKTSFPIGRVFNKVFQAMMSFLFFSRQLQRKCMK